jgi:hypothetical protein
VEIPVVVTLERIHQRLKLAGIRFEQGDIRFESRSDLVRKGTRVNYQQAVELLNGGTGLKRELAALLQPRFVDQPVTEFQVETGGKVISCETRELLARELGEPLLHSIPEAQTGQSVYATHEKKTSSERMVTCYAFFCRSDVQPFDTLTKLLGQARPTKVDLVEPYARCEVQQITNAH